MKKEIKKEFENGILREESEFSIESNLKDGLCKIYDRYGNIEEEIFYVAGKKQGKSKEYYKGEWIAEGEFFDGKKTGIWLEKEYDNKIKKYIYSNGKKKEVENFKIKNNNIFNFIVKLIILIIMLFIIFLIFLWNKNNCLEKKVDKNYELEEILNYPKNYKIIEVKNH